MAPKKPKIMFVVNMDPTESFSTMVAQQAQKILKDNVNVVWHKMDWKESFFGSSMQKEKIGAYTLPEPITLEQ